MRRTARIVTTAAVCVLAITVGGVAAASSTRDRTAAPAVPQHAHLYVIGDSWAAGLYADPTQTFVQVAAAALGWSVDVNAVSGTGYLNEAGGSEQSYPERAADIPKGTTADVVLVQGGSNDHDDSLSAIAAAETRTIATLRRIFPTARIVLLGPGPDPAPVTAAQIAIDDTLERTAEAHSVAYISMLDERWITDQNVNSVIDPSTHHPTVVGDAYLGGRLADALKLALRTGAQFSAKGSTARPVPAETAKPGDASASPTP